MQSIQDSVVLVTGGAGSLGKNLCHYLLEYCKPKKVIVYSRDEFKHSTMRQEIHDDRMRYFIGDVRDLDRLRLAFRKVDIVIHAAALKQVPACQDDPLEAVYTNIDGSANVVRACIDTDVRRAILVSSDKAVEPVNLYGKTKAVAEDLFIDGNKYKQIFSCTRWGNIEGSRGSVIPLYKSLVNSGIRELPVTDKRMTRFSVTFHDAISLLLRAVEGPPGLIWIKQSASLRIVDLVEALGCTYQEIGIRPGEKLHETLISKYEYHRARNLGDHYIVLPEPAFNTDLEYPQGAQLATDITSARNVFLTVDEIKERIA